MGLLLSVPRLDAGDAVAAELSRGLTGAFCLAIIWCRGFMCN